MSNLPPFHLAFPVASLAQARAFYGELLGCPEGRSSESWVDFDFHGHQIVAHLAPEEVRAAAAHGASLLAMLFRFPRAGKNQSIASKLAPTLKSCGRRLAQSASIR